MHPSYTFQVNLTNPQIVTPYPLPDVDSDNIYNQLEEAVVWIDGVPQALKHGDTFTVYGENALRIKKIYIDDEQIPNVLELVD